MYWNKLHQWIVNYSDSRQVKENEFECITNKYSLETKTGSGSSVLHFASIGKSSTLLSFILRHYELIHNYINQPNKRGETPLHWACRQGTLKIVKVLIQNGANASALDNELNTPLHYACESGKTSIVKYLASRKRSKIDEQNSQGKTPLAVACEEREIEIISILIAKGSASIVHILPKLIKEGETESIVPFLEHNCFSRLLNLRLQNPLHLAVIHDSYAVAETIMTICPSFLFYKDSRGKTPHDLLNNKSDERFLSLFSSFSNT